MTEYVNPNGQYPQVPQKLFPTNIPGISLPPDFALEAADRTLDPNIPTGDRPKVVLLKPTDRVRFPSRDPGTYGEAIARLVGSYSGPGFNIIFRPHSDHSEDDPENPKKDDLLELNLTHEVWKFPAAPVDLGKVPNRVAGKNKEDVNLRGVPYTQIVREVTDTDLGSEGRVPVDRLGKAIDEKKQRLVNDIHFEPGLFMHIPSSPPLLNKVPTISRMASIPHGTTINAQGMAAKIIRGAAPDIQFDANASTPFDVKSRKFVPFSEFDLSLPSTDQTRLPQNIAPFVAKDPLSGISQRMVRDPRELLILHNKGKTFSEVIQFTVSTAALPHLEKQACPHLIARKTVDDTTAALTDIFDQIKKASGGSSSGSSAPPANPAVQAQLKKAQDAIDAARSIMTESNPSKSATSSDPSIKLAATAPAFGSSNIAMLDGFQDDPNGPNARTGKVECTFWISTVKYQVTVKQDFKKDTKEPLVLPVDGAEKFAKDTTPLFVFPTDQDVKKGTYTVEATQLQYAQTVNLIFNNLVWPHISVATAIPVRPILVNLAVPFNAVTRR